jgi:uncharacterized protein YprB with RNaseH-like and TPR domain
VISRSLRQRIGALIREEGRPGRNGARPAAPRRVIPTTVEDILPGGVFLGKHGPLFVHERLYTELNERPAPLLKKLQAISSPERARRRRRARDLPDAVRALEPPERGLFRRFGHRRMLFLDIETCGLQSAPVFLVGLCHVGDRNLVLRQLFARDYGEERSVIAEVDRIAREFDFLVTFNGKTFDLPFLRDRAIHHRISFESPLPHLDLLWMARRRWRGHLPNCRLQTLEWHVLRRRRAGDVSGAEIPGIYHEYVKNGQPHRLLPIFHHNLLDLVAMAELLPKLFDPEAETY